MRGGTQRSGTMKHPNVTHPQISLEDFIYYYHIAHKRKNVCALNQLCHLYPELSAVAFQNNSLSNRYDPSECDYYRWHPITMGSAYMTERRIMDMVAYLFSQDKAPRGYKRRLRTTAIHYRLMFNYSLDRYQKDYDRHELWVNFFLRLPELQQRIEGHRIRSLMELEYRAAEYFMDND